MIQEGSVVAKVKKAPVSSALQTRRARRKVSVSPRATGDVAGFPDPGMVDARQLAQIVTRDRIARRMPWPEYATFLGVPHSTVYKIAQGRTGRPHELTKAQILERISTQPPPARAAGQAPEGATRGKAEETATE